MAKGIIAKIWNIKDGSKGRGAGIQISDSIEYITNSEKCNETLDPSFAQIGRELKYVTNDVKTLEGLYVGCRCISDIKNATNDADKGVPWEIGRKGSTSWNYIAG